MIHSDHFTHPTLFTINSLDLNQGNFVFIETSRPYVKIPGWGCDKSPPLEMDSSSNPVVVIPCLMTKYSNRLIIVLIRELNKLDSEPAIDHFDDQIPLTIVVEVSPT